jgi:hypothetical protein
MEEKSKQELIALKTKPSRWYTKGKINAIEFSLKSTCN